MDSEPNIGNKLSQGKIHGGVLHPMLRSYRGIILALVGLAAIGGGVGLGLLQQSRYEQEAVHRRTDYARHAADQIRQGCASITSPQQARCLASAVDEYALKTRDNQREYDDLVAQRTSALWASIMGVAALLGMLLSAVGVLLVWTTFQETKQTNQISMRENARSTRRALASGNESAAALVIAQRNADAAARQVEVAQDTAKRQLRAYIGVTKFRVAGLTADRIPTFFLEIQNSGQTSANRVRVHTVTAWAPWDEPRVKIKFNKIRNVGTVECDGKRGLESGNEHTEWRPEMLAMVKERKLRLFHAGAIIYRDAFGSTRRTLFFGFVEPTSLGDDGGAAVWLADRGNHIS